MPQTIKELQDNPCFFKIKDFDKGITSDPSTAVETLGTPIKVKKLVPKLDENGKVIMKKTKVPVKKGCACKGNQKTEMVEQMIPEMEEVLVDSFIRETSTSQNNGKYTLCKLYGTVRSTMCEKCKTYKKK